ncbi:BTB/POZ domain-containing protein 17-like isoform X1 [Biomphalaria glabrata]|uniref:BTB/POZ domain-containing protein 17-like isoform X1 n=2 Tax=Biomphalaria glabrata TaxID=6526 RepID=A0A2C9JE29_BIOGL|nr:BTB/POZ domain-containing protein 17-like isoform X1 [Biomphalaria glabrata]XP_013066157.1 BTB/POZ domain-containing protein 17-like isoform X1 [Biomphalaria glabrata]XP_055894250.1 BTB/POZ domain-containing protein 17-like isoform X1 [Biomphalaria glabrata]KAI8734007.1 BTB/POZ domain-containing protein 17-like isoform X1 [Biomphalaria glabrata]
MQKYTRPPLRQTGSRSNTPSRGQPAAPNGTVRRSDGASGAPLVVALIPSPQAGGPAEGEQGAAVEVADMAEQLANLKINSGSMEICTIPEPVHETSTHPGQARILRDESNFIQNVGQFYNQQDISDVILKIGNQSYFGHKFVLAKSSDVFRTMLYDKNWLQSGLPEIILEETEECQKYFDTFLRFLYTAEVNISVDSAVGILCLADKYGVTSLKNLCTQYMVEHTRSPLVKNALNWYSWSKALHMKELIHQCSKTIAWNAEQLLISPEWHHMDIDFVSDLLKNGDLVIQREDMLFRALLHWLESEERREHFHEYAKELLPLIRFPQMQVKELISVEKSDLYQDKELKPLLKKLINKAYRFRALCPHQTDIDVSFAQDFYLPRNYLDLAVDNVHMQKTLRYGIQVDVRTYVGSVPSESRDGEWKITYRKSNDTWTLQIYCHESALQGGEARVQAVLIITNQDDQVVQVEESEVTVCTRGTHLAMNATVPDQDLSKNMAVLFKPIPK